MAPHGKLGDAERRGEPDIFRHQTPAGRQRLAAVGEIFAARTKIGAFREPRRQQHPAIVQKLAVFLHEDRVETVGHLRAGEDAQGAALGHRAIERMAGGDAADDRKFRFAAVGKIAPAHGIAVDGGIVEERQIDRRQRASAPGRGLSAAKSPTLSVASMTGTRAMMRATASSTERGAPLVEKTSLLSCAIGRSSLGQAKVLRLPMRTGRKREARLLHLSVR